MKHLLAALFCFTVSAVPVHTIDGDTFTAGVFIWIGLKSRETVRVLGVNAPELHGTTREAGPISRAFTAD